MTIRLTDDAMRAGLLARRRAQIAALAGLIGLVACFIVLLLFEHQLAERARIARAILLACLLLHVAAIAYLRFKRCPGCGERFVGARARAFGAFTAMSQSACEHCGAKL